jgi:AsmA-like protein
MNALRRWWKLALALVALLAVAQIGASLLVRTHRVHDLLVAQLSRAFGRPVEVQHFEAQLLPSPTLDAAGISVGEDPAFGNEYFLRAESFSAGLRWTGLLRGQFEFGTLTFSRPSLILVRNAEGRWNLERWLPPAKSANNSVFYGPQQATSSNHLRTIEFDDGRVNFKIENDKQAFAFTNVAGRVEQIDSGRWQLQLQAAPWRSGVALQSTGTVRVQGDVAGTSARLQPAQIQVHWDEASLADLFRLWRGQDYGVRGLFALDATLQSGLPGSDGKPQPNLGAWTFSLRAHAQRLHRWDLPERGDNPRVNATLKGSFFSDGRPMQPATFTIEAPNSNLRGEFSMGRALPSDLFVRLDSMGVRAEDLLAWFRAFQPDVDEGIAAQEFFTGSAAIRGWPPQLESAGFSSPGGTVKIPGMNGTVQIGAMHGGRERSKLTVEPVRISWNSAPAAEDKGSTASKRKNILEARSMLTISLTHDFSLGEGELAIDGRAPQGEQVLRMAQAFGRTVNHGWEAAGEASASLQWNWSPGGPARWNGRLAFGRAQLQVAGLNQPVLLEDAALLYKDGRRTADIAKAQAFGATWRGQITEAPADTPTSEPGARWQFALQADKLDAADLDRWVGPRARPGWLQRLMGSLLGASNSGANANASELLRRVSAEGELRIDDLTIEKLHLSKFRAQGGLRELRLDVREADAQWAGGLVRGAVKAQFAPKTGYDISVELDRVNLAQLPAPLAARLSGLASGTLRVSASGVGRDELLQSLAGRAEVRLKNVELRGWDVSASMADGAAHAGVTRWPLGKGLLLLRDRSVVFNDFRLEDGAQLTLLNGRITFGQNADLSMENAGAGKRPGTPASAGRVLKISGPLDGPRVSVENAGVRQPAD